ncbi:MAG: DnaK suppressor protein [Azoarcus sp.]|nr:DnaK suppressor protein [Azoarcus sp.]
MMMSKDTLLAMPAEAYMNEAQRAFFRAMLVDLRTEMLARESTAEVTADEVLATPDPADRATLEEERTLAFRERERMQQRLREIGAALVRLDNDEFGYCEVTGDEIGLERLLVNPTATRSFEAQQQAEQTARQWRAAA